MEYFIISIGIAILLAIVFYILRINIKKVKELGASVELNKLVEQFPNNVEICHSILKKLNNTKVTVKEDKEAKASLYVVVNDSISIANISNTFTRVQTVAHECLHSIQDKRMLWFNFIFTNLYMLYFVGIVLLTVLGVIPNTGIYLVFLLIFGIFHYFIRGMLETEAMTKAKYVAKDYIEENKLCSQEECEKLIAQYDKMNTIGIKLVNYDILAKNFIKVIVYGIICIFI